LSSTHADDGRRIGLGGCPAGRAAGRTGKLRAALRQQVEDVGFTPPRADKSKRLLGTPYQFTLTVGLSTEIKDAEVERIGAICLMECPRMTAGAEGEGKRNAFAKLVEEDAFTPFVKRWQHSPAMRRSVNRPLINKNSRVRDGPNLHKDGCLVLRLNGLVSKGWDDECVHSAEIVK
jgi:hypothetical protein